MGFIISSICFTQCGHRGATLDQCDSMLRESGFIKLTYPSSSLLIWSQNPIIYSQSSCLLDGLVALSEKKKAQILMNSSSENTYHILSIFMVNGLSVSMQAVRDAALGSNNDQNLHFYLRQLQ